MSPPTPQKSQRGDVKLFCVEISRFSESDAWARVAASLTGLPSPNIDYALFLELDEIEAFNSNATFPMSCEASE